MPKKSLSDLYRDPLEERDRDERKVNTGWTPPKVVEPRPPALLVAFFLLLIFSGLGLRFWPRIAPHVPPHALEDAREWIGGLAERAQAFEREHGFFPRDCDGRIAYDTDCRPQRVRLANELGVEVTICPGHAEHAARLTSENVSVTVRPETRR